MMTGFVSERGARLKKNHFIFYGWLIVATGMVSYALGYGSRYSFSVIFPSLLEEFQWPRDITAAMLSFHILAYGFVAPMAGHLVDRVGPRKTMSFGTILLALGLALSGVGSKPWHFYLSFGVLSGAGLCLIGTVPFTTVIKNWFERKRGLALSLLFFGAGMAYAFYPAIAFLIDRVSWRNTFMIEAIIIAASLLPLIILIVRYHPREKDLVPDGILQSTNASPTPEKETLQIMNRLWPASDWTLPKAARTGPFWMLCLSTFSLWGVGQHMIVTHHVAFTIDMGYSKIYASSVLSLFGIFFSFGSLAAVVSDRIGRELTMTVATVIGISGIFVLILMTDSSQAWMLYYYAIALGFSFGMTAPTIAASATDIFRGPKVGPIIGSVWFGFSVGGFIGPYLGGRIFELTNSYLAAFLLAIVLYIVACAAIWCAAPRKVR